MKRTTTPNPMTSRHSKSLSWAALHPVFLLLIIMIQGCSSDRLLYPVKIKSFYGYISHKGELLIPPKYPQVQHYSEGFAPVQRSDGGLIFLNLKGEELELAPDYGVVEKLDIFADGMARAVVGQKVGYIDKQLRWAIAPQFAQAGRFSEGMAAILKSNTKQASYIDRQGSEVFSLENVTAVGPMQADYAYFVRDGRFGIVNKQGKIVHSPSFLFLASADPASGLARALDDKTELYGFIDKNGSWIISPHYPNARDFSGGFAAVFIRNKNRYGYIDTRGKLHIPSQYLAAGRFCEGFAWVRTDKGFRYIDSDGQWLSPLIFSQAHDFHEGLAAASLGQERIYINSQGTVTWPQKPASP